MMWALGILALLPFTWLFYLAIMNISRNEDNLSIETKIFAYPMLAIGLVADTLFNFTYGTAMFLELPRELLMTSRLNRHLNDHKLDWRDKRANWFCRTYLDPYDPSGKHCD